MSAFEGKADTALTRGEVRRIVGIALILVLPLQLDKSALRLDVL
jgi:hypothetical protein